MICPNNLVAQKSQLEILYTFFNSPEWIHPDPLEALYLYADPRDREIVGLIASSLAYGRVAQILKSVEDVLGKMGPSPYDFIKESTSASLGKNFRPFRHRFTTGQELIDVIYGIRGVLRKYGSLYDCFCTGLSEDDETIFPALSFMVKELTKNSNGNCNSLLPLPKRGSACKRLNLYLRWMVRKDLVDPGGWGEIPAHKLIIPLDTHMHRICGILGMTKRKSADQRTAIEVTKAFRRIVPEDPVRYDFALTRLGIRRETDLDSLAMIHCQNRFCNPEAEAWRLADLVKMSRSFQTAHIDEQNRFIS